MSADAAKARIWADYRFDQVWDTGHTRRRVWFYRSSDGTHIANAYTFDDLLRGLRDWGWL